VVLLFVALSFSAPFLPNNLPRVPLLAYYLTRNSIFDKCWVPSRDDSHKQEAAVSCRGVIECVVYTCSMFSSTYFPPLSHALSLRKPTLAAINEPGVQTECDGCLVDLTHAIRIKCADPVCAIGDGVDLCPNCFCSGKEFGKHKRGHAYRVEVTLFAAILRTRGSQRLPC